MSSGEQVTLLLIYLLDRKDIHFYGLDPADVTLDDAGT
jgi:hypothetical protein